MRQPLFLLYIVNNNDINKETELSTQQFIYLHKYMNYQIQILMVIFSMRCSSLILLRISPNQSRLPTPNP